MTSRVYEIMLTLICILAVLVGWHPEFFTVL